MPRKYHALESYLIPVREHLGGDGSGEAGGATLEPFGALRGRADLSAVSHRCNRLCLISPNLAMRSFKGNEGNWRTAPQDTKAPLKTLFVFLNPLIPLCN